MLNPPISDRIPRFIPKEVDIVHKTGLIYDNAHDVGIIFLPGSQPVLISAFTDNIGTNYLFSKNLIGSIARIIYDASTTYQPDVRYKSKLFKTTLKQSKTKKKRKKLNGAKK